MQSTVLHGFGDYCLFAFLTRAHRPFIIQLAGCCFGLKAEYVREGEDLKISIIGGGGRVGSNAAYALQLSGLANELAIVDVALEQAQGEAMDLMHGSSLTASQRIYAGGYEAVQDSDIVLITAGLRRQPGESRLELINRNVTLFRDILQQVKHTRLGDEAVIIVVSNPVDVLTMLAVQEAIVPSYRVIGLGTLLDTARFRSLLGEYFNVDPGSVNAVILGEHGDSMVPMWSTANIGGAPLAGFEQYDKEKVEQIFESTKKSGAEVIRLKGGAGYAVGVAIKVLIEAIVLDTRTVLPVSSLMTGQLGIDNVCLSLPTVVGRSGVLRIPDIAVSEEEKNAIRHSAGVLKETLATIG